VHLFDFFHHELKTYIHVFPLYFEIRDTFTPMNRAMDAFMSVDDFIAYLDSHYRKNPVQPILFCADIMCFFELTNVNVESLIYIHEYAHSKNVPHGTLLLVPCGEFEENLTRMLMSRKLDYTKSTPFITEPKYVFKVLLIQL